MVVEVNRVRFRLKSDKWFKPLVRFQTKLAHNHLPFGLIHFEISQGCRIPFLYTKTAFRLILECVTVKMPLPIRNETFNFPKYAEEKHILLGIIRILHV